MEEAGQWPVGPIEAVAAVALPASVSVLVGPLSIFLVFFLPLSLLCPSFPLCSASCVFQPDLLAG